MELNQIAVPGVYALIFFLGYPSQALFLYLDPAPLTKNELVLSNVLLVCIFITYTQSVFVDPGTIPKKQENEREKELTGINGSEVTEKRGEKKSAQRTKWCRKCEAVKPPRSHHCKECKRCIPKMDHHCPWTANCVSHTTFPHFLRFLFYTSAGLYLLAYFQFVRIAAIWAQRDLPAYLGPNPWLVAHLFFSTVVNCITLFALFVLFVRNIWCLAVNTTTIEGWEIERHRTLVRRARVFGGWLEGPDGEKVRIEKREFPYDVGIWANIKQGMGTGNPLSWFNPLARTPPLSTGLTFPTNGFEDAAFTWPPPDPDRSYRRQPRNAPDFNPSSPNPASKPTATNTNPSEPFTYHESNLSPSDSIAAFRARQAADSIRRRKPFVQRMEEKMAQDRLSNWDGYQATYDRSDSFGNRIEELGMSEDSDEEIFEHARKKSAGGSQSGEEAWRNSEGERLKDFGVDEDVEFYDEQDDDDDVPLSELLARKRAAAAGAAAEEPLYT